MMEAWLFENNIWIARLEDFIPTSRDQKAIDRMTLIALNECRSKTTASSRP